MSQSSNNESKQKASPTLPADQANRRYVVLGAGAIGCYVGGWLAHGGGRVTLLGRSSLAQAVSSELLLQSVDGQKGRLTTQSASEDGIGSNAQTADASGEEKSIRISTDPKTLADADVILVAVKSGATGEAAEQILKFAPTGIPVLSLQNGLSASRTLKKNLPNHPVAAGMVTFNVVREGEPGHGLFRQSTSGPLTLEAMQEVASIAKQINDSGVQTDVKANIERVQWSKLLLNLNNAINALCGIPVRAMLSDRGYRRIISECMKEALSVYKKAGIKPVRLGKIMPSLAPAILALPDFLFFRVAATMINIDPNAMTSMAQDLMAGKLTEVDFLNGEIVSLAESVGARAPVNQGIQSLIHEAEQKNAGSPELSPTELAKALGLPSH